MRRKHTLRRRYGKARGFRIGSGGLEKTEATRVVAGHVYAMGASYSPSMIKVASVTGDQIKYHALSGDASARVIERWIGEDLIARGERTFKERYGVSAQRWHTMSEDERAAQWRKMFR